MDALFNKLKEVVGPRGYQEGEDIDEKNYQDLMRDRSIRPQILLRPANTDEISKIMALCHEAGQPVVPQGGMTGLVSAAAPKEGEISLSFDRMNRILELDPLTATMTVEAGVPLQTVQEHAKENGFLFPLDLGARGSCTIGGNLSTNAGGNRVIRYGMARDLVLGVEAVLANGTVINGLHKLAKNNTGYDLKHLFIGSEGTLGIITRAVLKLTMEPRSQVVAFCALNSFDAVAKLLTHMRSQLGGSLSAFEVLWQETYQLIEKNLPLVKLPLPSHYNFYVLVESLGTNDKHDRLQLEAALQSASEEEIIADAVFSHSSTEVADLWNIRDSAAEVFTAFKGGMHGYDVSFAVGDMEYFGEEIVKRLKQRWPDCVLGLFGHIGDGNLHITINVGPDNASFHREIDEIIYTLTRELKGAVSAEHGIGMMKQEFLGYSRSSEEISLMQNLKQALDPKGILSPNRIFENHPTS